MMMMVLPLSTSVCRTVQELLDVVAVQACGGLVEEIEGLAGGALGQLAAEFDALRFAAGEGGHLLAELEVAEADGDEGVEDADDAGMVGEGDARLRRRSMSRYWPRFLPS